MGRPRVASTPARLRDDGTGNPFCLDLSGDKVMPVRWSWIDSEVASDHGSWADFYQAWRVTP